MEGEKIAKGMKIRARVVEGIVVLVVLTGLILSASSAGGPSLPLLLYGEVSYKDGSPAPNVGVSAKNEVSGQSLATTTDGKGVWSLEVSEIANCGDVVIIVAKDARDNEVSEKVNVTAAPQRIDLQFDVSPPTTTPPSDGGSSGGGETTSGTQSKTEQGTEAVTPTPLSTTTPPSPSTGISNATVSENESNISQSNLGSEPEENADFSIFNHKRSKSVIAVVSIVIALVAGLAFVTLLIYRHKNKRV